MNSNKIIQLLLYFSPTTLHLGEIHQLVQIGRTLYVEFAFLVLQGCHQWLVIDPFHRFFDGATRVLHHVFHQLTQGVVGQVSCYLLMGGLVHTVSTFVL